MPKSVNAAASSASIVRRSSLDSSLRATEDLEGSKATYFSENLVKATKSVASTLSRKLGTYSLLRFDDTSHCLRTDEVSGSFY